MTVRSSHMMLPFGELAATLHSDPKAHADYIDQRFPGLVAYEALENQAGFFSKTFALDFPKLTVVATALSASRVERDGQQNLTLILPLAGNSDVTMDGKTFQWGAGHSGMLLPEFDGRLEGIGGDRLLLLLRLDVEALTRTAQAIRGPCSSPVNLNLDEPRTVPLELNGCPVGPILNQLGNLLDLMGCEPRRLSQQGYEELLNRLVVGLLHPEIFAGTEQDDATDQSFKGQVIDRLCDEMLSQLGQKITLTQLEQKSGYSARTLQYAFKERFGCSPLEWLRDQRLHKARQCLLMDEYPTIHQLAEACGFGSTSQFYTAYKQRFGETPSETRQR